MIWSTNSIQMHYDKYKKDESSIFIEKAYSLMKQGRYDEADNIIDQAIRQTPTDSGLWICKGLALGMAERYDEATCIQ